ncbi:hybrid sensor histidine kinase/response regulator [Burkholderia plantarii]|uniref:Virulence sensor protein BvgS n=1 Tax=Burkholderia plantarii TaxID=41899 RepID=A0A0B6RXZ2_BURPL|nr:ATP-binding protein [Burkholderia plantarii]AJK45920.1 sensor kinase protein RcsC [Burkholderia plantarii]
MQQILNLTEKALHEAFGRVNATLVRGTRHVWLTVAGAGAALLLMVIAGCTIALSLRIDDEMFRLARIARRVETFSVREAENNRRAATALLARLALGPDPVDDRTVDRALAPGARCVTLSPYGGGVPLCIVFPAASRAAYGPAWRQIAGAAANVAAFSAAVSAAEHRDRQVWVVGLAPPFVAMSAPPPGGVADSVLLREVRDAAARAGGAGLVRHGPLWLGPFTEAGGGSSIAVASAIDTRFGRLYVIAQLPGAALEGRLHDASIDVGAHDVALVSPGGRVVAATSPQMRAAPAIPLPLCEQPDDPGWCWTSDGLAIVRPANPQIGFLVHRLDYAELFGALRWPLGGGLAGAVAIAISAAIASRRRRRGREESRRILEREAAYHLLAAVTPAALFISRRRDAVVLIANTLAGSMLGIVDGEPLPTPLGERLSSPQMSERDRAAGEAARIFHFEYRDRIAPRDRYLRVTFAPVRYHGDDVLVCVVVDVTRQKQVERALGDARRRAEALVRMRTGFIAAISHEIRTPLSALIGHLELMADEPMPDPVAARLKTIEQVSRSLLATANDMLDMSRLSIGKLRMVPEDFSPLALFDEAAQLFGPLAVRNGLRFTAWLSPSLRGSLHGDPARIGQIVTNLLSNALKFTRRGAIVLRAQRIDDADGTARLVGEVRDTGPGIAVSEQKRIFAPFEQGGRSPARRRGGAGLGLAICAELCRQMSGLIRVESELGRGACFRFEIPLTPSGANDPAPRAPDGSRHAVFVTGAEAAAVAPEGIEALTEWLHAYGFDVEQRAVMAELATLPAPHYDLLLRADTVPPPAGGAPRPTDAERVAGTGSPSFGAVLRIVCHTATDAQPAAGSPAAPYRAGEPFGTIDEWDVSALARALDALTGRDTAPCRELPAAAPQSLLSQEDGELPAVLVVDDNVWSRNLLAEHLRRLGVTAHVARGGTEALAMLRAHPVGIVMTDLDMPGMSGQALLAALRADDSRRIVIAVSASVGDEDVEAGLRAGFDDYIGKPATFDVLSTALLSAYARLGYRATTLGDAPPAGTERPALGPDEFARYLGEELAALRDCVAQDDAQRLSRLLHRLRGALAWQRLDALRDDCAALERLAEHGDAARVRISAMRLIDALDALRARLASGPDEPAADAS